MKYKPVYDGRPKICSSCGETKPVLDGLWKLDDRLKHGLDPRCQACNRTGSLVSHKEHPEIGRKAGHKHRTQKAGNGGETTKAEVKLIDDFHQGRCIYCWLVKKLADEHILAINNGGVDFPWNRALACQHCNSSKGDRPLEEWLPTKFSPAKIAEIKERLWELSKPWR